MLSKLARNAISEQIGGGFRQAPIVALLGPRQCGKTTLARLVEAGRPGAVHFFDLEHPRDLARLADPLLALEGLGGIVILDEIQHKPELFPLLRVLADRNPLPARFLILGSASPALMRDAAESLAGRVFFIEMTGFRLHEVGPGFADRLWIRGGFPRSYLAATELESYAWREDFIRTFLERDLPQLGISIPAVAMRRFWTMLAHLHGRFWNAAELARAIGSSQPTAQRYLDILTGSFVVRALQPWFENIKKRQVKSPKIYIRDSGLLHALLGIQTDEGLLSHPVVGASWEGFVLEQLIALYGDSHAYTWRTRAGAELDLLLTRDGRRYGFEIKRASAPTTTRSMHAALADLKLEKLIVVIPGRDVYPLAARIEVRGLAEIVSAPTDIFREK